MLFSEEQLPFNSLRNERERERNRDDTIDKRWKRKSIKLDGKEEKKKQYWERDRDMYGEKEDKHTHHMDHKNED